MELTGSPGLEVDLEMIATSQSAPAVLQDPLGASSAKIKAPTLSWREILAPIIRMPMLWAAVLGCLFNVIGVPLNYLPLKILQTLSQCFPPLLYLLLGSVLRFRLGGHQYLEVLQALCLRCCIWGAVASVVWFTLPLSFQHRVIIVLICASPTSTTLLQYSQMFGYDAPRSAMTYNLSAVLSMAGIHVLSHSMVAR